MLGTMSHESTMWQRSTLSLHSQICCQPETNNLCFYLCTMRHYQVMQITKFSQQVRQTLLTDAVTGSTLQVLMQRVTTKFIMPEATDCAMFRRRHSEVPLVGVGPAHVHWSGVHRSCFAAFSSNARYFLPGNFQMSMLFWAKSLRSMSRTDCREN